MNKIETLTIQPYEIEIHYKKIKNSYLRIKPDGKIMISAPLRTKKSELVKFVKERSNWIGEIQQQINERKKLALMLKKDEILLFGKPVKADLNSADLQNLLHEKILIYYEKYWPFFKEHGIKSVEIKYRVMKSTWGVCRRTAGTITFSKRLVHQPIAFIEYIVLHEMCHLLISGHGSDFYGLVALHMPHFRENKNAWIAHTVP